MKNPPQVDLSKLSDEELVAELARRRGTRDLNADATAMEDAAEGFGQEYSFAEFAVFLEARSSSEDDSPKRCPRCGVRSRVRERAVPRTVRSTTGVHEFRRNRHYCEACKTGFFPLDLDLGLPDEGEVTSKLEGQILDMGLHAPFEQAAERWSIHHPLPISDNLVRCVVDRVGRRAAETSPRHLAEEVMPADSPAEVLIISTDGSMLPMRGKDGWREVKMGVVYRGEHHSRPRKRGLISQARYVAVLGDVAALRAEMDVILALEKADQVPTVAWVGDGAAWNWGLADEICPNAHQVLDWFHAVEHAAAVGAALFPEDEGLRQLWVNRVKSLLHEGEIQLLLSEIDACRFLAEGLVREMLNSLAGYYRSNEKRLDYPRFRKLGLPCGSGVAESSHRHVLQARMKLTGQHWDPARAARLVRLRAAAATAGPKRVHSALCRAAKHSQELARAA